MMKSILKHPPTMNMRDQAKEESIQQLQDRALKLTNQLESNFSYVQSCLTQFEASKQPLMSDNERQMLLTQQQELEKLKGELESLSHEKVVLDVLTRPLVQNAHLQQQLRNIRSGPKIPFSNSHQQSTRSIPNNTPNTNISTVGELEKTIMVPEYIPLHQRQSKLMTKSAAPTKSQFPTPLVRNTTGGVVVPNLKLMDNFPEDLKHVKTKPIMIDNTIPKKTPKVKRRKVIVQKSKSSDEIDPLVLQQLQQQYEMTQIELQSLGKQLVTAKQKFQQDKESNVKRIQLVLQGLQEQQWKKDQYLLHAIDQLIEEAIDSFQDLVHEHELLPLLEELFLSHTAPSDLIPPSMSSPPTTTNTAPNEYKILEVSHKPAPMMSTTAMNTSDPETSYAESDEEEVDQPLKEVIVEEPLEEVVLVEEDGVQTDPIPEKIIVETKQEGIEKQLVELLQHIVTSQQVTMQGQQALLLTLLSNQQQPSQTTEIIVEEEEVPVQETLIVEEPEPVKVVEDDEYQEDDYDDFEPVEESRVIEEKKVEEEVSIEEPPVISTIPEAVIEETPTTPFHTNFGTMMLSKQYLQHTQEPSLYIPTQTIPPVPVINRIEHANPAFYPVADNPLQPIRRRVSPLILHYLQDPILPNTSSHPHSSSSGVPMTTQGQEMIHFATALLQTVNTHNQQQEEAEESKKNAEKEAALTKEDIHTMIQQGISQGIEHALHYFNPFATSTTETDREKNTKSTNRRFHHRDIEGNDVWADEPLHVRATTNPRSNSSSKHNNKTPHQVKQEADNDHNMEDILAEMMLSERHCAELAANEAVECIRDYGEDEDSILLDEAFHALYDYPTPTIPGVTMTNNGKKSAIKKRRSSTAAGSIISDTSSSQSDDDSNDDDDSHFIMPPRRRQREGEDAENNGLHHVPPSQQPPIHSLPPLHSHVLPHKATHYFVHHQAATTTLHSRDYEEDDVNNNNNDDPLRSSKSSESIEEETAALRPIRYAATSTRRRGSEEEEGCGRKSANALRRKAILASVNQRLSRDTSFSMSSTGTGQSDNSYDSSMMEWSLEERGFGAEESSNHHRQSDESIVSSPLPSASTNHKYPTSNMMRSGAKMSSTTPTARSHIASSSASYRPAGRRIDADEDSRKSVLYDTSSSLQSDLSDSSVAFSVESANTTSTQGSVALSIPLLGVKKLPRQGYYHTKPWR